VSGSEDSVPSVDDLQFRLAGPSDARAVAELHADSWRRHYRGAYADAFLDGDVHTDRLAAWTARLSEPDPGSETILAEDGEGLAGFVHTVFDDDQRWGALLDNLHVAYRRKRRGIGSRLLRRSAQAALDRDTGLYLWVLEQNADARAFYEAHGGTCVERMLVGSLSGAASRVNGSPAALRYAWPDPAVALTGRSRAR